MNNICHCDVNGFQKEVKILGLKITDIGYLQVIILTLSSGRPGFYVNYEGETRMSILVVKFNVSDRINVNRILKRLKDAEVLDYKPSPIHGNDAVKISINPKILGHFYKQ